MNLRTGFAAVGCDETRQAWSGTPARGFPLSPFLEGNAVHDDVLQCSDPWVSPLGLSSRPLVIKFLTPSGSGARDPSKTRRNITPGGTRERKSSKTLGLMANRRPPKDGPETIPIHGSLIQYAFGGATSLIKLDKSSCRARFASWAAGTQTAIFNGKC